jgi:hypothetical protein
MFFLAYGSAAIQRKNIICSEGNRHPEVVNYLWLAPDTRYTVYHNCRTIYDSWIFRQDSLGDWKMAYHHLSHTGSYFSDHMNALILPVPARQQLM